jgi:hypothetical protein
MQLDKKLKYIIKRIGKGSDRVTTGKTYIAEYAVVFNGPNTPSYGWLVKNTDDPHKTTTVSLSEGSKVWEVLHPITDDGIKYYKKIKSTNAIPVGTILKLGKDKRSTPDSPFKWTNSAFEERHTKEFWGEIPATEYYNILNKDVLQPEEEELPMATPTKVETVTQINGENANILSNDAIINAIKEEQNAISNLGDVKVESTFITKQIAAHQASIAALVAILDAR